jgi:hypothetical protein
VGVGWGGGGGGEISVPVLGFILFVMFLFYAIGTHTSINVVDANYYNENVTDMRQVHFVSEC